MGKVRITNKDLPFINKEVEWDNAVLKKIEALQKEHQAKFDRTVEATKKEALERYTLKLEALNKAKAEMTRQYDAEIKKYEGLVKNLKSGGGEETPNRPSTKKTSGKTASKQAKSGGKK
ncbi:MAG: hypothetical protein H6558_14340 [Lewinellaceae bacterium]|nr:hypothetical protein [Lewinellaceae bacterium]MCB9286262.1 hypothetical protein [Lewinellaceae bacterium]